MIDRLMYWRSHRKASYRKTCHRKAPRGASLTWHMSEALCHAFRWHALRSSRLFEQPTVIKSKASKAEQLTPQYQSIVEVRKKAASQPDMQKEVEFYADAIRGIVTASSLLHHRAITTPSLYVHCALDMENDMAVAVLNGLGTTTNPNHTYSMTDVAIHPSASHVAAQRLTHCALTLPPAWVAALSAWRLLASQSPFLAFLISVY